MVKVTVFGPTVEAEVAAETAVEMAAARAHVVATAAGAVVKMVVVAMRLVVVASELAEEAPVAVVRAAAARAAAKAWAAWAAVARVVGGERGGGGGGRGRAAGEGGRWRALVARAAVVRAIYLSIYLSAHALHVGKELAAFCPLEDEDKPLLLDRPAHEADDVGVGKLLPQLHLRLDALPASGREARRVY